MPFLNLNYFVKTVQCQSFTKASEELYVSQSAVSKAVRNLEEELQTTLIDRNFRKFTLTKEGEIVYDFAKDIIDYYDTKEKIMLKKLEETDRVLRFGLPPTAGSIYFYSVLYEFQKKYPNVELNIDDTTSTYIVEKLLDGQMDMGVAITPFEDDRFEIHKVFNSEATLVVGKNHPLSKSEKVDFRTLKDEKFLQVKKDFMYYDVFLDYCNRAGFTPNIVFESNQWDLIIEMVAANQGITILPKPLTDKYSSEKIHQVHLENPEFPWGLNVIYLKSKILTRPMKNFLNLCIK